MSCGVGRRLSSDPELLWLWRRPVATALIPPLAWEPPYAAGVAQEITKRQKKKKKKEIFWGLPKCDTEIWVVSKCCCNNGPDRRTRGCHKPPIVKKKKVVLWNTVKRSTLKRGVAVFYFTLEISDYITRILYWKTCSVCLKWSEMHRLWFLFL